MCIICYSPAGTMPTELELVNCNSNNPDGFGWAIRTHSGIITGKTMDSDQAIDQFLDLRQRHIGYDAVYHARITTHGTTSLDNNHPFTVGDKRTVLVHNGMLPIDIAKGDTRSDTRIFAEQILPARGLGVLDKPKARRKLEKWISGSKMVIMSTRKDLKQDTYILNESSGIWDNGLWYSNSTYTYTNKWWLNYSTVNDPLDDALWCAGCDKVWENDSEPAYTGVCSYCFTCLDCFESRENCFCYDPRGNGAYLFDYDDTMVQG